MKTAVKKTVLMSFILSFLLLLSGCGQIFIPFLNGEDVMIVGKDIKENDINEFKLSFSSLRRERGRAIMVRLPKRM